MAEKFYGDIAQTQAATELDRYCEDIAFRGYAIIPGLLSADALQTWRTKIDSIYAKQESEFGREALIAIQELDVCRAPLLYDSSFLELASHPLLMSLMGKILGDWFILNLQNAVITRPNEAHHQSSWHRDLPYQNWVISKPLALSALYAIDDFSEQTGGTQFVPFTHKAATLPSQAYIAANRIMVTVPAGAVIVFDAMLFHRAGTNSSHAPRRSVNHVYTSPILKQQYDFPRALGDRPDFGPDIMRLLGYTAQVPVDDRAWRSARASKRRVQQ